MKNASVIEKICNSAMFHMFFEGENEYYVSSREDFLAVLDSDGVELRREDIYPDGRCLNRIFFHDRSTNHDFVFKHVSPRPLN